MNKFFCLLFVTALFVQGCQRSDTPEPANEQVTITITQPAAASVVHKGQAVPITGTIQAGGPLHGYTLQLFNRNSGEELMAAEYHEHGNSFAVSAEWKDTLSQATPLELKVVVVKDHEGNKTSKSILFESQP